MAYKLIYTVFFIVILHNYNVNGSICESECLCRPYKADTIRDIVDCSYQPRILTSSYELPIMVHSLDLSMNNISDVNKSNLLRSKTMKELFLNENSIKELNNVFELPELRLLDLSDNVLEFIHEDTFKGLPKLEYLNLSNNLFDNFDKLTFHYLTELKEIVLNNNNIGASLRKTNIFADNGFGLTHNIESISIRKINLNIVPDNFFVEAYNLKKLVIANNNLKEIFEIPFTLEYLDISDNPIQFIEMEDFANVPPLKELKLNNLHIKEVPEFVFSPLHALVNLELDRNRNLTEFSALAFGNDVLDDAEDFPLRRLTIKGSRLTTIDEQLAVPFGQLTQLDLQSNPWKCDCYMLWVKKLQIPSYDREQLRCAFPRPLYNKKLFELNDKYFVCSLSNFTGITLAIGAGCAALATLAIWITLCMPKQESRCTFIQNLYNPATAYTVLPLTVTPFEARV